MTTREERNEKLAAEREYKEHVHHTKINAATIADHIIANIYTLHVKLHQYHWYVKGKSFYILHETFEDLYNENETWFDKIAETLLAGGFKVASTTAEFQKYKTLSEDPADKYLSANEMVENIVEDFRSNREFTIRAIRLAQEEGNEVLEDTLIAYKKFLDINIYKLQAFLGKEALEDDDYVDDED